jgi:hypothetical protein
MITILFIIITCQIIALVDVLKSEFAGSNKIIWFLVVVFLGPLGVILYFTIGKNQKIGIKPKVKVRDIKVNWKINESSKDEPESASSSISEKKKSTTLFDLLRDSEQKKDQSESNPRFTTTEEYIQWKEKLTKEEYIQWKEKWTGGNEKNST